MSREAIVGDIVQLCPQCGNDWTIPETERLRLFDSKSSTPKRCPDCRRENQKEAS